MSEAEENLVAWLRDQKLHDSASLVERLTAERDALREFIEDLRMQAVHAASAELTLANEYIIARCNDALKGDDRE